MSVELTNRDLKALNLINQYGCIYRKNILPIFTSKDGGNKYAYRRIARLEEYKYLEINNKLITLGVEGKRALIQYGYNIHYDKVLRTEKKKSLAETFDVLSSFPNFTNIKNRLQLINIINYNSPRQGEYVKYFIGKVTGKDNVEYVVYRIKKDAPLAYMKRIIGEINELRFENVIVSVENESQIKKYKTINIERRIVKREVVFLNSTENIQMINLYSKLFPDNHVIAEVLNDNNERKIATLEGNQLYVNGIRAFNMIGYNQTEEDGLKYLIEQEFFKDEIVICMPHQQDIIREIYPQIKNFGLIRKEKIIEKIKKGMHSH